MTVGSNVKEDQYVVHSGAACEYCYLIHCYAQPSTRIGAGGQGIVFKYTHRPTGKVYAAKVMQYNSGDGATYSKRCIVREQTFSPKFEHAHLMKAHEVFEYPEGFVIVMPHYLQGSLAGKILNPTELKNAVQQILKALCHLHDGGFIHRDIKPASILVSEFDGERLHLVVADYGLMTSENPVTVCGTRGYIAPEIFHNSKVCKKSEKHPYLDKVDIYALGILILRMLGIDIPENFIDTQIEFTKHVKLPIAKAFDKCKRSDSERKDLLNMADRMLQYTPIIRPSADECLQLPCLGRATAIPAAIQWPSPSSVASTIKSVASAPVNPVRNYDWGSSIVAGARYKPRRETKKRRRLSPAPRIQKFKVQKTQHHPLPTPSTTPQKNQKVRKFEDDEPEDAEMATDAPPLSNWDKPSSD